MTGRPDAGGRDVLAVGDSAVLVRTAGPRQARALAGRLLAGAWPDVREVVGGLRSVLVVAGPGAGPAAAAAVAAATRADAERPATPPAVPVPSRSGAPRRHLLRVALDGPDLADVCRHAGLAPERLAALLTAAELEVAAVGFSPGFAYLQGLPLPLRSVPRRPSPRPSVPAGSFAVAGGFAAVYPHATPGGWHLVGRSDAPLFDPGSPPYALLHPGDLVGFELAELPLPAGAGGPAGVAGFPQRPPWTPAPPWTPVLAVEDPGALVLAQDAGRAGLAHLGVPAAGPADALAHGLANLLVGNDPGATALEATARGPVLRNVAPVPVHVAVVGGDPAVLLDGREVGAGHVVPVAPGQRLAVGPVRAGLRAYVAVAGGLGMPAVLGSTGTDLLARLGPGPLVAGDVLGRAGRPGPMADHLAPAARRALQAAGGGRRVLRVLPGPHPAWFHRDVLDHLASTTWTVEPTSDRVGVRLRPLGTPGVRRRPGELDSQGMVTGAVQVPPSGVPVVLGPDHATLGGYPVAAVVVRADHWVLGQCRPGEEVVMEPVTWRQAELALAAYRRVALSVGGHYPTVAG